MPTFEDLVEELDNAGALFQPGKGGIWVTKTTHGAVLQNFNKEMKPVRFSNGQANWLVSRFPELTDTMTRNMETMRRVQGLKSRIAVFMGAFIDFSNPGSPLTYDPVTKSARPMTATEKKFVESLPPRQYAYLESLDGRSMPATLQELDQLSVKNPEALPRAFTVVDITDPHNPVRLIFQVEFDVSGLRTDEAFIRYKVSPEEMALLQQPGKTFATDVRKVAATDVQIFYSDTNKHIYGEQLLEHHIKTLETLEAVAKKFFHDYAIVPVNAVLFSCKEIHMESVAALVENGLAKLVRPMGKPGLEAADKVTTTVVRAEPVIDQASKQVMDVIPHVETKAMATLRNLDAHQVAVYMQRLSAIAENLKDIAKKAF
jgi:hypothetical protein